MINDFSTKYPTMEGSGSWGSKANPNPAAPRYTECKISKFAVDVFARDIYEDKTLLTGLRTMIRELKNHYIYQQEFQHC